MLLDVRNDVKLQKTANFGTNRATSKTCNSQQIKLVLNFWVPSIPLGVYISEKQVGAGQIGSKGSQIGGSSGKPQFSLRNATNSPGLTH